MWHPMQVGPTELCRGRNMKAVRQPDGAVELSVTVSHFCSHEFWVERKGGSLSEVNYTLLHREKPGRNRGTVTKTFFIRDIPASVTILKVTDEKGPHSVEIGS